MSNFRSKWEPKDVIALVALVICGALLAMGYNSTIHWAFGGIIAAYVGADITLNRKGQSK